jgi:hypothetical protein
MSLTTYDHVNSDGSQSVRAIQSYSNNLLAQQIVFGRRVGTGVRKPTDDVGRMRVSRDQRPLVSRLGQKVQILVILILF